MNIDLESAELLEKGAAYIEEHGLWQGDLWPDFLDSEVGFAAEKRRALAEGLPVCAQGALYLASPSDCGISSAVDALGDALQRAIPLWNDAPGRTAAEVADAMRACATNLRGDR